MNCPPAQVTRLVSPIAAAYFDGADDEHLIALVRQTVSSISGVAKQSATTDPRVLQAIVEIRKHIDELDVLEAFLEILSPSKSQGGSL